ncbi:MAG: acyl-CoA dehydrogenase [Planctomycetaceae bacterium]|nr:acyl-CoA dehydrogenase [Planctomycetaceae bacterium]
MSLKFKRMQMIAFLFVTVMFSCATVAQETATTTESPWQLVGDVLGDLQRLDGGTGDVLVKQSELDKLIAKSGGGACPSAAAVIATQALRGMAGIEPHANPHRLSLQSFEAIPALLDGRVSNKLFVELLLHYEKHINGIDIEVEIQSAPNSPYATDNVTWETAGEPHLEVGVGELKILSFSVTQPDGSFLGRHFVLLKKNDESLLHVLDPTSPVKDKKFTLARGADGTGRFYLEYPPEIQGKYVNELNTVFTIRLSRSTTEPESLTIEQINSRIDDTAKLLMARSELRSPRAWRRESASYGLPALDLPVELGGLGWNSSQMLEVFRHAGKHDLNLRDVVGAAHARVLLKSDAPRCKAMLQEVAAGKRYFAITITEPEYGSDFASMVSTSKKVDGGFILNGEKRFNARLEQATDIIVITRSTENKPRKLSAFVVPIDAKGLKIETFGAHGLTGNSYGGMTMNDVFVPDDGLLGVDGGGRDVFEQHFLYWRLMQTAAALGTAEGALEQMAERLKTRIVYGGPIGRFTHLQQPMGQHTTELRMAHALAVNAAKLLDDGNYKEAAPLINGLKAEGVEIALSAVDAAARAFGGEGYSDRVDIGDRLRDLNGLRIADGATDVMRSSVVSDKFGREFWEMAIQRREREKDDTSHGLTD